MESQSYLSFKLGDEMFASSVSKVLNILDLIPITKVPKSPRHMKGVINLRGEVLPLIDARVKLGVEEKEFTKDTCILVLDIESSEDSIHVGAIVDSVHDVFDVTEDKIMQAPTVGNTYNYKYIRGVVETKGSFTMLLEMDSLFAV